MINIQLDERIIEFYNNTLLAHKFIKLYNKIEDAREKEQFLASRPEWFRNNVCFNLLELKLTPEDKIILGAKVREWLMDEHLNFINLLKEL